MSTQTADQRAALVREARLRIDEWQRVAGDPVALQNVGARLSMTCDRLANALEAADEDARQLRQALAFYAADDNWIRPPRKDDDPVWPSPVERECSAIARMALHAARAAEETGR